MYFDEPDSIPASVTVKEEDEQTPLPDHCSNQELANIEDAELLENLSKVIEQDLNASNAHIDPNLIEAVVQQPLLEVPHDFETLLSLDNEFRCRFKIIVRKYLREKLIPICVQINDAIRLKEQTTAYKAYHENVNTRFDNLADKIQTLKHQIYQKNRILASQNLIFDNKNAHISMERTPLVSKNPLEVPSYEQPRAKKLDLIGRHTSAKILENAQNEVIAKQFSQSQFGTRPLPNFLRRSQNILQGSNQSVVLYGNQQVQLPMQFTSAPLPPNPHISRTSNLPQLQPACHLSIKPTGFDVTLSWKLLNPAHYGPFEPASHYEIYSYNSSEQKTTKAKSSSVWKLIGDVRALPLPMTCVIRDVAPGHVFYFAIYSVDGHGRRSNWSNVVQAIVS